MSGSQLMEIEIKFAKGKLDYVNVHRGDDPIVLAKVSKWYLVFFFLNGKLIYKINPLGICC